MGVILYEKNQPDVGSTPNSQSLLGGALLGQKKYAEVEPLLLKRYEGMKQRAKSSRTLAVAIASPGRAVLPAV
jgi:hypothetical protein